MERCTFNSRSRLVELPDYLDVVIGSQSSDVIGIPVFFGFFYEISFIKRNDVEA